MYFQFLYLQLDYTFGQGLINHLIIKLWVVLVVQNSSVGMFGKEGTSWITIDTLQITERYINIKK